MASASDYVDDDEELARALEMSCISYKEEEQWNEVLKHVLVESGYSNELRFVVIGETGSGKSETSNSILLSRELFESAMTATSVTKTCKIQKAEVMGRTVSIVDTPGLFDADMDAQSLLREITRCTMMTAPGPHAILLVIRIGRMSQQVQETVRIFREVFGDRCTDHLIVVFTGKKSLSEGRNSCTVEEYVGTAQKDVADTLNECENRYVVFENSVDPNSKENQQQVETLLSVVDKMVASNGGRCYTNDMFEEAACKMKEREERLRQQYEEEKQTEMQTLRRIYEDELKDMEIDMTQNMDELITQNRDRLNRELREIEEKYNQKDARHEARKDAENSSWWQTFLGVAPTLFKLGLAAAQLYGSIQANTLGRDMPRHVNNILHLMPQGTIGGKKGKGNNK